VFDDRSFEVHYPNLLLTDVTHQKYEY